MTTREYIASESFAPLDECSCQCYRPRDVLITPAHSVYSLWRRPNRRHRSARLSLKDSYPGFFHGATLSAHANKLAWTPGAGQSHASLARISCLKGPPGRDASNILVENVEKSVCILKMPWFQRPSLHGASGVCFSHHFIWSLNCNQCRSITAGGSSSRIGETSAPH